MKTKFRPTFFLVLSFALFLSCDEEENQTSKEMVFDTGDISYSLADSELYLVSVGEYENREHRTYCISDGTHNDNGDEFIGDIGDFVNASFVLRLDILSVVGGSLSAGDFPQKDYFFSYPVNSPPTTSRVGHVFMTINSGFIYAPYYITDDGLNNNDSSPIKFRGGLDNNQEATIEFEGKLTYTYFPFPEGGGVEEEKTCKIIFTGKVHDVAQ